MTNLDKLFGVHNRNYRNGCPLCIQLNVFLLNDANLQPLNHLKTVLFLNRFRITERQRCEDIWKFHI